MEAKLMNMQKYGCALVAIALNCVPANSFASSEGGELIAHPNFTLNGCPLGSEWTDDVVNNALGLQPRMLARLKNRFSITKETLCSASWEKIEGFVRHANNPKHRTDEPDGARAFRALQQRDESGTVKPTGLMEAIAQRVTLLPLPTGKPVITDAAGIASNTWTWLGPGNIGGRVRAISPHPTNANELLIGSVSGGIWRTTNGGASWSSINDFLPNVAISCLVRDPANASVIYACTGEGYFNQDAVRGLGIFKSTDNGDTWAQLSSTNPVTAGGFWYYVYRLAISPTNSQVMLAATDAGIHRTTDGGATWTRTYGTIPSTTSSRRVVDVGFHPTDSNIAVLGELSDLGVSIALDDFGTGYSSLGYLRRFPVDKIKIDRSFIRDIDSHDTAAIVRTIIGLGQELGITVTAEGVETDAQLDTLRKYGCVEAQGYLIGVPSKVADLNRLMKTSAVLSQSG